VTKKFKNDKIFSKFLEIWTECPLSYAMLGEGSVRQDSEWIMCFTTFQYPPGACSFSSENTVSVVMCRSLSWCHNVYEKYADMVMMKKRVWCMLQCQMCHIYVKVL